MNGNLSAVEEEGVPHEVEVSVLERQASCAARIDSVLQSPLKSEIVGRITIQEVYLCCKLSLWAERLVAAVLPQFDEPGLPALSKQSSEMERVLLAERWASPFSEL